MKTALIALMFVASAAQATMISGDKIEFQKHSTWVSAVYNKSLCLNGDTYEAVISKCLEVRHGGDDDRCVRFGKILAKQPMVSTRQRCAAFAGRDEGTCRRYETVPFVQKPVRTVKFERENGSVYRTQIVTIPACK